MRVQTPTPRHPQNFLQVAVLDTFIITRIASTSRPHRLRGYDVLAVTTRKNMRAD